MTKPRSEWDRWDHAFAWAGRITGAVTPLAVAGLLIRGMM